MKELIPATIQVAVGYARLTNLVDDSQELSTDDEGLYVFNFSDMVMYMTELDHTPPFDSDHSTYPYLETRDGWSDKFKQALHELIQQMGLLGATTYFSIYKGTEELVVEFPQGKVLTIVFKEPI